MNREQWIRGFESRVEARWMETGGDTWTEWSQRKEAMEALLDELSGMRLVVLLELLRNVRKTKTGDSSPYEWVAE